jgi:hypothetical protein
MLSWPLVPRGLRSAALSAYSFLDSHCKYVLPESFDFAAYIDTERELWALFPETYGMRVNFCQVGLTASLFVEVMDDGSELASHETYFLMPFPDRTMRPMRMRMLRKLTLAEYRLSHITAQRMSQELQDTSEIMDEVHLHILGPEIVEESP